MVCYVRRARADHRLDYAPGMGHIAKHENNAGAGPKSGPRALIFLLVFDPGFIERPDQRSLLLDVFRCYPGFSDGGENAQNILRIDEPAHHLYLSHPLQCRV